MSIWTMTGIVAAAGGAGGVVAALLSEDKGFVLPQFVTISPTDAAEVRTNVLRPGFVGLIVVGAIAAALSWALYGPVANDVIMGATTTATTALPGVTFAVLGGAVLVGMGGSKWLSSQVDQTLLRYTATVAATKEPADSATVSAIATAGPAMALQAVQKFKN